MNISAVTHNLPNTWKVFQRLPNSCFADLIRKRRSIHCITTTTQVFPYTSCTTTVTICPRLLQHLKYFTNNKNNLKNRFISTAKDRYLNPAGLTIYSSRLISTKTRITKKPDDSLRTPLKHSALSAKIRKKVLIPRPEDGSGVSEVVAFATSEEIQLEKLDEFLASKKVYQKLPLPSDVEDAIYAKAVYEVDRGAREVFFFREGAVVFWNMSYLEMKEILQQVRKFCNTPYDPAQTLAESESLNFSYPVDQPQTTMNNGYEIRFGGTPEPDAHILEKYAFSDALGLSVKLALWELSLVQFVESIEPLLEDLRSGRKIRTTRENLLRKTGQLFTLRHLVNLSSDLLDTPDFYWDREGLEPLYQKTINYLNVSKRTRVMNEKLKHCCELIELLSDHLNDQHHTRLEVMIIILISVEVVFEIVHYIEKYYSGADHQVIAPSIIDR